MKLSPQTFPIDGQLDEIISVLKKEDCLLLKAETGAGKTTRLPPYLVDQKCGRVLVLEPRRLAAKLSAQRCADTLKTKIGEQVGHHIRFDKKTSDQTELVFITEGLFLSYLKEDPKLSTFDFIILDEFHERSIHTDMALTLIRRLQKSTRPDLKLIIMSATLDTQKLEDYLEVAVVMNISGRTFPLEIEYHEKLRAAEAIQEMASDSRCPQNILVFLPGVGQIKALSAELKSNLPAGYQVNELYSALPKKETELVFTGDQKKIILATNIAETSLTIPRITGVIDLGIEKRASFAPWSGMPLLLPEKISKASAIQRAGRAGRIQEGIVYRLYSEIDYGGRMPFTPPEVKRVELSHYLLDLFELEISLESIHWFEDLEEKNLEKSLSLLELLGAIKEGVLSEKGRFMAQIPLHPRLAAMLWQQEISTDLLLAIAILSEGMVLSNHAEFSSEDHEVCDLALQCNLLKAHYLRSKDLSDYHHSLLDKKKAARVKELYQNLCKRFKLSHEFNDKRTQADRLTLPLLQGFPDRVAIKNIKKLKKGPPRANYNFCMGRGGMLSRKSALGAELPEFIIVLDALENPKANAAKGTLIHAAAGIPKKVIDSLETYDFLSMLLSQEKKSSFNEKKGTLKIETQKKYGNLVVKSEVQEHLSPKGELLSPIMKENWPWPFDHDDELKLYHQKVSFIEKYKDDHPFASFEEEMFDLFIESIVNEETTYPELKEIGLAKLIEGQLAPQELYLLEQWTPNTIKLSNAKEFAISYDEDRPYLMARIQDLYGVNEHPAILDGELPLQIKLLSPANRVAQIISDLPSFWQGSWSQVRQDLKARYPKHHWPEDPANSRPIRLKKDL